MSLVLIIVIPLLAGASLFAFAVSCRQKRDARTQAISLVANIATIVGVSFAVLAVVYGALQYETYLRELSKKPDMEVCISPRVIPKSGLIRYSSPSAQYTEPMKIIVEVTNIGQVSGREVLAVVGFTPNVQVLSIDYRGPGFEMPTQGKAVFMLFNHDVPILPGGPSMPLMELTIRLQRMGQERIEIAQLMTNVEGKRFKIYQVFLDPISNRFNNEVCQSGHKTSVGNFPLE